MKLRDLMVVDVVTISPDEPTTHAARKMAEHSVGSLVVTIDHTIKGIVTDRDLLACLANTHNPERCKVSAHMTRSVIVAGPDEELFMAAEIMADKRIKRLPVVEKGKLVGLISFSDIADMVNDEWQHVWWRLAPMTRLIRAQTIHRRGSRPHAATVKHPITGL